MVSNPSLVHSMLYLKYLFQMSEAHPDAIQGEEGATLEAYTNDLAYLKRKVLFTFLIFLLLSVQHGGTIHFCWFMTKQYIEYEYVKL